jgi:hypothetical protein
MSESAKCEILVLLITTWPMIIIYGTVYAIVKIITLPLWIKKQSSRRDPIIVVEATEIGMEQDPQRVDSESNVELSEV